MAYGGERTRFSAGHRHFIDHGGLLDRRLDAVHRVAHLFRPSGPVLLVGGGHYPVGQPLGAASAQSDSGLAVPPYQRSDGYFHRHGSRHHHYIQLRLCGRLHRLAFPALSVGHLVDVAAARRFLLHPECIVRR